MPITFDNFLDALKTADDTNGKLSIIEQYIIENPEALSGYFIDVDDLDDIDSDSDDENTDNSLRTHQTALDIALSANNLHSVSLLIALGTDINKAIYFGQNDEENYSCLQRLLPVKWESDPSKIEFINVLSQSKFKLDDNIISQSLCELYTRNTNILLYITTNKTQALQHRLQHSTHYTNLAIATMLHEFKYSPEVFLDTIIEMRASRGVIHNPAIIEMLIELGLDVNYKNSKGMTFLHSFISNSMINPQSNLSEILELFFKQPNLDTSAINGEGKTIFDYDLLDPVANKLLSERLVLDTKIKIIEHQRLSSGSLFSDMPRDIIKCHINPMIRNKGPGSK